MSRLFAASLLAVAGAVSAASADVSVERGEYLVRGPAGCGNCHTPMGPEGFLMDLAQIRSALAAASQATDPLLRTLYTAAARAALASRFCFDRGAQSGDVGLLKLGSSLANDSRQNLLAAYIFDPVMLDQTGLTVSPGLAKMLRDSLLLLGWSWTAGFVLGSLSRRAILVNGMLVCGLVATLFSVALTADPPPKPLLLLSLVVTLLAAPLIHGTVQGLRHGSLNQRPALLLAASIALLTTLSIWSAGWWCGGPWNTLQLAFSLLPLVLCWPAVYIAATASSQAQQFESEPRM